MAEKRTGRSACATGKQERRQDAGATKLRRKNI